MFCSPHNIFKPIQQIARPSLFLLNHCELRDEQVPHVQLSIVLHSLTASLTTIVTVITVHTIDATCWSQLFHLLGFIL